MRLVFGDHAPFHNEGPDGWLFIPQLHDRLPGDKAFLKDI